MRIFRGLATLVAVSLVAAAPAWAQSDDQATRPASSTILGDSGLWFVPMGETLPKGKFSGMAARVNFDRSEGFSDISDINGMFAFGATDKIEIFGTLGARRIDADHRPWPAGGQPMDYMVNDGWQTGFGDLTVGAKFNVRSQATTGNGPAFAVRAAVKLPTASFDDGLGTGQTDFMLDGILSKELNEKVDVAASRGFRFRGSPDDYELSNGLRYGVGVGYPSRSKLQDVRRGERRILLRQDRDLHRHADRCWRPALVVGRGSSTPTCSSASSITRQAASTSARV